MNKKILVSNFNFANFLSVLRILSAIPLIICLNNFYIPIYKYYSIIIIIFIFVSDFLDGFFARKLKTVTQLGKIIDPVADKICLIVVLIYLIDIFKFPFLLFFILLSLRDIWLITYTIYLIVFNDFVSQANSKGKIFIFLTAIMIISFIYNAPYYICCLLYLFR